MFLAKNSTTDRQSECCGLYEPRSPLDMKVSIAENISLVILSNDKEQKIINW